eukprot:scaffold109525_cov23-Tisochrysis_lutea.AAC.1
MGDGEDPKSVWEETKGHIATFLREETAARAQPSIQSALELNEGRETQHPAREAIRAKRETFNVRDSPNAKRTSGSSQQDSAKGPPALSPATTGGPRLHKEFFAQLKTRRWKSNVTDTELFKTRNWDQPATGAL